MCLQLCLTGEIIVTWLLTVQDVHAGSWYVLYVCGPGSTQAVRMVKKSKSGNRSVLRRRYVLTKGEG